MTYLYLLIAVLATSFTVVQAEPNSTFTNPIVERGQDPWVVAHEGVFYYCYTTKRGVAMRASATLIGIGSGEETVLWKAPETGSYSRNVWAPELHRVGNRWYVYFAADDGANRNHRMYALRSEGDDPAGPYVFVGKVTDETDRWAIDGTIYQSDAGRLYFIWSGWEGEENIKQDLYISAMSDPVTIEGPRVLISTPEFDWERVGDPDVNEGPQVLRHDSKVHVIYSASGSWADEYCLGRLTLVGDDPMDPASWQKHPEPVFRKTDKVFGPGHASFVHLENTAGPADWIVYHSARHAGAGWDRVVNLQPFTWDDAGNPVFGKPVDPGVEMTSP